MTRQNPILCSRVLFLGVLVIVGSPTAPSQTQFANPGKTRTTEDPPWLRDLSLWALLNPNSDGPAVRSARVPILRMPSAFLNDQGIPDPTVEDLPETDANPSLAAVTGFTKNFQVILGEDNPFFDFRRRQTPGGTGFYKVQTQFSLFDTPTTGCALTCRAVTPAGIEWEGVNEGPTFFSPALTLFHDLGGGTVFQGFLGKDLFANSRWRESMDESIHYGLAWQQPVLSVAPDPKRGLFVFLEALGRYRDQGDRPRVFHAWELLPGLHLRMSEDWWLSGGVIVPVGPIRPESGLWHITCSRQF